MSVIDKIKGMLKGHEDQAHQAVEKAGDMFDAKTQGKFSSQVDAAQSQINKQIGNQPPADPQ
ncbi:antitoxin [Streptacidiphilus sp. PAMC 29251]